MKKNPEPKRYDFLQKYAVFKYPVIVLKEGLNQESYLFV